MVHGLMVWSPNNSPGFGEIVEARETDDHIAENLGSLSNVVGSQPSWPDRTATEAPET